MRRILVPLLVLTVSVPFAAGCGGQSAQTEPQEDVVKSYALRAESSDFAFRLFQHVASPDYSGNIVLSPLSARLALAMAYNGAGGETREAMAGVLDLEGMSLEEVNRQLGDLVASLQQDEAALLIEIADSLWANREYELDQDFARRCLESYGAEVASLDFSDPATPDTINAWVKEKTHDKIDRIVGELDPNLALILVDAVYFNGKWQVPFDASLTADGDFHLLDGTSVTVPFMHRHGDFSYYENGEVQAVSLPYGEEGARMSMYVILPREGTDYGEFLAGLNEESWDSWMGEFSGREGSLALPRFKMEHEKELSDALKAMGMGPAFVGGLEDMFVSTGGNLAFISKVLQKTYIDVNEEGTEAAAVTSLEVALSAMPVEEPFDMAVDRPFVFAIRDDQTGALLFLGSITDPTFLPLHLAVI